jgi:hypothetical protein
MLVKYLYLTAVYLFVITLSFYANFSFSSTKGSTELGTHRNTQSTITFEAFDREFIFTNSAADYHRSFQRLISNYGIRVPEARLPEILLLLTEKEEAFVETAVSALVKEAIEFSHYKENQYYTTLTKLTSKVSKLNIAAALEIALVDQIRIITSVPMPLSKTQSSEIRFLYLINHARYELVSAMLHSSGGQN